MKRMLIFFAFIPLFTNAQSPKKNSIKLPSIQSITTDTVKGKFYQIVFSYDQSNRVIAITNTECKLISGKQKKKMKVDQIIRQQSFEYMGSAEEPFLRKIEAYEYIASKNKWYLASIAQQYFLYKNGQRIGDSTLIIERDDNIEKWDEKVKKRIGFLKQTSKVIYHEMDLMKLGNDPMDDYRNIYIDKFILTSQSNIRYDSSEHLYANHGGGSSYYTFTKFDSMLNPLKNLNIANILRNEKICLYDGVNDLNNNTDWKIFRGGNYGNVDFNWYFVNRNNPVNYFTTVNDQSSPFKQVFNFSYRYNQFKQPIFAKAQVKYFFNYNGKLYSKQELHITFRYQ